MFEIFEDFLEEMEAELLSYVNYLDGCLMRVSRKQFLK
jgi:hypothetical protein